MAANALGALIAAGGIFWALWAAWTLHRAATPRAWGAMPSRLVDEGPYRFGRNPMAFGIVVALVGTALALGSALPALAAAAFVAVVQRRTIPAEEAALQRAFGGWYSDYRSTVRRWI